MSKLLKEAIADAKAVREAALNNAKEALQEAFAPKIQALVSNQIAEEMNENEDADELEEAIEEYMGPEEDDEESGPYFFYIEDGDDKSIVKISNDYGGNYREFVVRGKAPYGFGSKTYQSYLTGRDIENWLNKDYDYVEPLDDEADFDDYLSEDELDEAFNPTNEKEAQPKSKIAENNDDEDEDEFEIDSPELPKTDPKAKLAAMKDISAEETTEDESEIEDEEIDLDELLAEYESEEDTLNESEEDLDEAKKKDDEDKKEKKDEKESKADKKEKKADKDESEESEEDEEIDDMTKEDLADFIRNVVSEMNADETPDGMEQMDSEVDASEEAETIKELSSELMESKKTIKKLMGILNENNLLNAKLLYVNRLFKKFTLDESKKTKIVNKLDEAKNVKEAKLIYESIHEMLLTKTTAKKSITESVNSFASKPAGKSTKSEEIDPVVNRLQFLANIKIK